MADERPVQRRRFVPAAEVRRAFAGLPRVDYQQLRADLDELLDQDPTPRWIGRRERVEVDPMEVMVGDERSRLVLVVKGWSSEEPGLDEWSAFFLEVAAEAHAPPFRGAVSQRFGLHRDWLVRWRRDLEQLYERLEGEATLPLHERWIELSLSGAGGHVRGDVVLRGEGEPPAELRFSLQIDQTYLPPIIDSLLAIEAAYPARPKS